jgi:NADH-quinone oxidoreductase subunit H
MEDLAKYLVENHVGPFPSLGEAWTTFLLMFAVAFFLLMGFFMPVGGLMTYVERKIAAFTQSRIGPNRVGPFGLLQFLADGVKLILKEDIIPADADAPLFRLAPYAVVGGAFMVMSILPLGPNLIPVDADLGILVYLAASSFVTMGIVMSGWASGNKWSTMGAARSVAQIVSYEIPVGMSLLPLVLLSGSLSFQKFAQIQGAYPWQWSMFHNPGLFLCVFCYFIAALAEINRTPFDIPEAESELVSGYNTEYSGMRFGMFFVAEFANVMVISVITVVCFLGAWHFPGEHMLTATLFDGYKGTGATATPTFVEALQQHYVAGFVVYNVIGHLTLLLKSSFFIVLIVLLRWTLPRVRVDQLMNICWKYLVPMTIFATVLTGAWMAWLPTDWNYDPRCLPLKGAEGVTVCHGGVMGSWNKFFVIGALFIGWCVVRAFRESSHVWTPARKGSGHVTSQQPSLEAAHGRT